MSKEFNKNGLGYTPYLDKLSKNSIGFKNYSCSATVSFENYTIMTGYPYIHNNEDEFSYKNGSISNTSVLLGFFGKAKEIISSFALVDTPN